MTYNIGYRIAIRQLIAAIKFRWKYRKELKYIKWDILECPGCGVRYHNYRNTLRFCFDCKSLLVRKQK